MNLIYRKPDLELFNCLPFYSNNDGSAMTEVQAVFQK